MVQIWTPQPLLNGNGGMIVAWSDVTNQNALTEVNGRLFSEGGYSGGNGGQIETSGYQLKLDNIDLSARSYGGEAGVWLIDPYNITIQDSGTQSSFGGSSLCRTLQSI
jgi:fibronectin-binding autotransporter adhesin